MAKLYNDGSATVEETDEDGWYKIKSGNAIGYVKSEYFATGEQAKEIADKVAYNVAVVNAKALNVRATPSEESTVIDVASESEELEVVDTSGEWANSSTGKWMYMDSFTRITANIRPIIRQQLHWKKKQTDRRQKKLLIRK